MPAETTVVVPENEDVALRLQLSKIPDQATTPVENEKPPVNGGTGILPSTERTRVLTIAKATLVLHVKPSGEVLVDGISRGNAGRGVTLEVEPGQRTVEFTSPGFSPKTQKISVRAGERKAYECYFERRVSVNSADASGKQVWGTIVVDGVSTDYTTPKEFSLKAGKHTITVSRAGYQTVGDPQPISLDPVIVEAGRTPAVTSMKFELRKN